MIVCFFLLSLAFLSGARVLARALSTTAALPAFARRARGRRTRADRRRRPGRAAGRARARAQPRSRPASGRLRRRRPAQAAAAVRGRARARHDRRRSAADPRRGRARRGHHRDPVGARASCGCASSRACRERGIPRPHAADGVRAAAPASVNVARHVREVARRGRARARAGADGARPRRRATSRARSCWSPAPAARSARSCAARSRAPGRAGSSSSTTPRTTCSRSCASSRRTATSRRRCSPPVLADCKEEERMREVLERGAPVDRLPRRRLQARRR